MAYLDEQGNPIPSTTSSAPQYLDEQGNPVQAPSAPKLSPANQAITHARDVGYSGLSDAEKKLVDDYYPTSVMSQSMTLPEVHAAMDAQASMSSPQVQAQQLSHEANPDFAPANVLAPTTSAASAEQALSLGTDSTGAPILTGRQSTMPQLVMDLGSDVLSLPGRLATGAAAGLGQVAKDIYTNAKGDTDFDWYNTLSNAADAAVRSTANPVGENLLSAIAKDPLLGAGSLAKDAFVLLPEGAAAKLGSATNAVESWAPSGIKHPVISSALESRPGQFFVAAAPSVAANVGLSSLSHALNTASDYDPNNFSFAPFTGSSTIPLAVAGGLAGTHALGAMMRNNALRDWPGAANANYTRSYLRGVTGDLPSKLDQFAAGPFGVSKPELQARIMEAKTGLGKRYSVAAAKASPGLKPGEPALQTMSQEAWEPLSSADVPEATGSLLGDIRHRQDIDYAKSLASAYHDAGYMSDKDFNKTLAAENNAHLSMHTSPLNWEKASRQWQTDLADAVISASEKMGKAHQKLSDKEINKELSTYFSGLPAMHWGANTASQLAANQINRPSMTEGWSNFAGYSDMTPIMKELADKMQGVRNVKVGTGGVKQELPWDEMLEDRVTPLAERPSYELHGENAPEFDPLLNAEEMARARTGVIGKNLYSPKIASSATVQQSKLVAGALHDAWNKLLLADPRYAESLGRSTPWEYKKLADFSTLVDHPGAVGLANRLPLLNFSVDPWRAKSLEYNWGKALLKGSKAGAPSYRAEFGTGSAKKSKK